MPRLIYIEFASLYISVSLTELYKIKAEWLHILSEQWRSQDFSAGEAIVTTQLYGGPGHVPRKFCEIWDSETAFPVF